MEPVALGAALEPLLEGDLAAWRGLPEVRVDEVAALLGDPRRSERTKVGAYPAQRLEFGGEQGAAALIAFVRDDRVVMVEVQPPPDRRALEALPEPTAILPQEISAEGAYAHELLYAEHGLLVTLAEPLREPEPRRVLRCRGIRPLAGRAQLGPELYLPLDTDTLW